VGVGLMIGLERYACWFECVKIAQNEIPFILKPSDDAR
jgi:hypothetical protein